MISLFKSLQIVSTPDDRYELVKNRRNPVQKPSVESISGYEADLDRLATILCDTRFSWYLEGGMAIAAHLGQFHRRHSDTDIGVFDENIVALEESLAHHNYGAGREDEDASRCRVCWVLGRGAPYGAQRVQRGRDPGGYGAGRAVALVASQA